MGRWWLFWLSCGAEDWVVEALCSRYLVPVLHLLPVLQEPLELPTYELGSFQAWSAKML